ncbi:hypothetical protein AAVH_26484 [Aphelenchoides avenae]|nr:hypothetical protein AAVH_26484 [Aphelenchus avenae]
MYKAVLSALRVAEFSPKFILADGTPALTTAAKDEFPNAIRGMCSAHFIRQLNKRKSQMSKEEFEKLRSDVEILRHARNIDEFNKACTMMLEAWNQMQSESVDDFAAYVRSTWLDGQLFGWFEGLVPYVVNNNGLESLNASIKRDHTLRRTLPLPVFLETVEKMLRYWATSLKDEPTFPEIPLKVFKAAYELNQQSRLYCKIANEDAYVVTSSVAKHTTPESLFAAYQRSFVSEPATWDEYCTSRYEVFKVARSVLCGGSYYTCTCPEGTKKRVCKHAVLIMCEAAKVTRFPPAAMAKPLVNSRRKKPTEGRPTLAAPQNRHAIA